MRSPDAQDGAAIWALVRDCGVLSPNSSYAYVLMADQFAATCAIAERGGRALGAVIGFRPPRRPNALFVWQIGVHPDGRGEGLAQRMLDSILGRPDNRDIAELLTTVAPGNDASERLFRRFAQRHGASIELIGGYPADFFPDGQEAERLFQIGRLNAGHDPSRESSC